MVPLSNNIQTMDNLERYIGLTLRHFSLWHNSIKKLILADIILTHTFLYSKGGTEVLDSSCERSMWQLLWGGVCGVTSPLYGYFASTWKAKSLYFAVRFTMKQPQLSAGKRLAKPILFGTLLVGLATAFYNRYVFFCFLLTGLHS